MDEEFNNLEIDNKEEITNIPSPNKQNKFISTRKRKELINIDSDKDEKITNKNISLQKIQNEESKEQENIQYINENMNSKYINNKYNTIDKNNVGCVGGTSKKDNSTLQEKLKKIFMNRDKLKFQYTKQDIPDNLKYNSDESESSEISGLKKSKISKKSHNSHNSNINIYSNHESKRNSNKHKNSYNSNNSISSNKKNSNEIKKTDLGPLPAITEFKNDEKNKNSIKKENNLNKKLKNEENNKINIYNEEEKTKSNEKNNCDNYNKFERGQFNYNKINTNEEEKEIEEEKQEENKEEEENTNITDKRESAKKNILLKMFEKRDKKNDILDNENENNDNNVINDNNDNNDMNDINDINDINKNRSKIDGEVGENERKNEDESDKKQKKQKLLKLLLEKKNSNTLEYNDIEKEEESSSNNNINIEKEQRRKKIIEQIQNESNNILSPKIKNKKQSEFIKKRQKQENKENININKNNDKEKDEENQNIEEKEEIDNNDNNNDNDNDNNEKGTYISNKHKNKLTISIKPKTNLVKQISSSSIEDKIEKNEKNENDNNNNEQENENKNNNKNKKANALLDILEKLRKKKTEQENITKKMDEEEINNNINDDINESEIEKEAEKIRKKEKKMEERRLAREKQKSIHKNEEETENITNNNRINYGTKRRFYNTNYSKDFKTNNNIDNNTNNNNNNKSKENENEIKKEEKKRRKQFEEDLRAEINDYNKEDESTVNNSSKSNIISNSTNTQIQLENEDKNKKKESNIRQIPSNRNTSDRLKNFVDESAAPNEIVINDIPRSNLDRSFDATNTYMKRKIPNGRNTLNVYKPNRPKRVDIRGRSQGRAINEFIENNSNSCNPNQVINYNNINKSGIPYNNQSKLTYIRKKSSFNDNNNFILNNSSFCENRNRNIFNERDNINMEIDLGGGLNSSFDAYMKMNYNNNINDNNSINRAIDPLYGTTTKKFNNGNYNKATYIPGNNLNNNKKYVNNNYYKKVNMNNNDVNRSFGYINNNNFNNSNIFTNYNNSTKYNNNNNEIKSKINGIRKNKSPYMGAQRQQFITYNNSSQNSNLYNNSPIRTNANQLNSYIENENYNNNNYYPCSPSVKRYGSTRLKGGLNNTQYDNYTNNNTQYSQYNQEYEKNTSINIEDLMVLEEKLKEVIIALNNNHAMHNECFEFWNYYFNCSFYGKLEKLFKNENDSTNVQISINHILISVMICYDFSFEMDVLNNEYSILLDILELNHKNLIIIYEHILSKISSESKSNPWVYKLQRLVNNYNRTNESDYISMNGRKLSSVEKITYNVTVIVQNIRVLLKNYKTKRSEYLTTIFKKINEKTYDEINSFFRDNILRIDNINGSVLASVFLKENENFQTEPAPYIKTKNRKKYSLILDLDETLVHFKINNEDDSEGVLQIRPGVVPFLEKVGKYYELIVFTAATQDYGDLLIDAIEENNIYFEYRFYRQHTVIIGNDFVKDLNRIGRPIDKIIIVDNMPQNFRLQKENGINIKAFWGEDVNDNALEELGKILENIAKDGGDVRIGLEKYRDEIVKKVTSNISKTDY